MEAEMTIVVVGDPPTEIQAFIKRRKQLGLDGSDEVWEGVYHVVPHAGMRHARVQRQLERALEGPAEQLGLYVTGEFNLGDADSYRVPDLGVHAVEATDVYVPSAVLVGEVISPGDETWAKFEFYARQSVPEILVAEPLTQTVRCFLLTDQVTDRWGYVEGDYVNCCGVRVDEIKAAITWP
jgi:hypothetical protein